MAEEQNKTKTVGGLDPLENKMENLISEVMNTNETVAKTEKKTAEQNGLIDKVGTNTATLSSSNDYLAQSAKALRALKSMMANQFQFLKKSNEDLVTSVVGNDLKKAEDKKEAKKEEKNQSVALDKIAGNTFKLPGVFKKGLSGLEKKLGGGRFGKLIAGFATAVVTALGVLFSGGGLAAAGAALFAPLAPIFAGISTAFAGFITAIKVIALPLTIAIGVIGAIIGAIKGFKEEGIVGAIKGLFTGALDILVGSLLGLLNPLIKGFTNFLGIGEFGEAIVATLNSVYNLIRGSFVNLVDGFKALFTGDIEGVKAAIAKQFANIGDVLKKFFMGLIPQLAKVLFIKIPLLFGKIGEGLFNLIKVIGPLILEGFTAIKKGLTNALSVLPTLVVDGAGFIVDKLKELLPMPLNLLKDGVAWLLSKFGMNTVADALKGFDFTDTVKKLIDAPVNLIKSAVNNIKEIFGGDGSLLGNIYRTVGEIVSSVVTFPLTLLQKAIVGIGELFGFDMESVSDFDLAGKIKSLFRLPFDAMASVFDFIKNLFSAEGREKILLSMGKIGDKMKNFAKDMLAKFLPKYDPSRRFGAAHPLNVAHKLTPKALYDFAGIDKKSGKKLRQEEEDTSGYEEVTIPAIAPPPPKIETPIERMEAQEAVNMQIAQVPSTGAAMEAMKSDTFDAAAELQALTLQQANVNTNTTNNSTNSTTVTYNETRHIDGELAKTNLYAFG